MIVYHGSISIIKKPDISYSKQFLDFGKGFYVTSYKEQAKRWAKRKSLRTKKTAFVNVYELIDDLRDYRVLSFEEDDEKWLDFVCACRKGQLIFQKYDVIIGNVANDDVFRTVDMYFRGLWSKDKALEELRYFKLNDQICIITQKVLDEVLIYKGSYQMGENHG
ncbi:DUF3990 domain-containing protein [Emergencia sp.]|uniref:DUF3990 domain-containing protein n=1 Tax=Emergencia sp. TaxID=1926557 RepID=UPI003AEF2D07